jgi:hypothetical protein
MPKYSSHLLLAQLQHQTNQFLDLAIGEWQMLPHSRFGKKPAPGSWSANECLQHLNIYGDYYLPAINKAIITAGEKGPVNPIFHAGLLGHMFTKMMMPATGEKPLKKMKAPKESQPKTIPDSHQVIATFIDQQEQMLQLLEKAKSVDLNKIKVPISINRFIKMKLGDTFHFLIIHNLRHVIQAQKALGASTGLKALATQTQQALL